MPRHAADPDRRVGDRLVRLGVVVFGAGLVAVLSCLGLFLGDVDIPLWLAVAAATLPLGLGLALIGLLRSALARPGA